MTRWIATTAIVMACGTVVSPAAQRPPNQPCEPAAAASPPTALQLIETARCYDDRWAFVDAERLLAAAIVSIENERAPLQGEVVPGGGAVFVGGDVVTPALTNRVAGEYPAAAANKGISGVVVVGVTLKTDGSVRTADVVQSIPELDKAAVDTVKKMRFAKTLVAGNPVEVSFFVPARFGLAAEATPADWMILAKSYLAHGHRAAALQTLLVALELERKDIVRFGHSSDRTAGRSTGFPKSVKEPQRVHYETPKYPPAAMSAQVQGIVIAEALIDLEGRVGRARVLKSVPGLDAAALDAMLKWVYTPTLVDGKPVSVILTVTANFALR